MFHSVFELPSVDQRDVAQLDALGDNINTLICLPSVHLHVLVCLKYRDRRLLILDNAENHINWY